MNWPYLLLRSQRGAASVEFAFTIVAFIFMVFFFAETARLAYLSAVIDLAVSEAAKEAKNAPADEKGGYLARFENRLTSGSGTLWGVITRKDAIEINITYAASLEAIISSGGSSSTPQHHPIASYHFAYRYTPMFFPFPTFWANNLLNREVIFVQEYERSKFMH